MELINSYTLMEYNLASSVDEVKQFSEWLFERLVERFQDGDTTHWYLVRDINMNDVIRYSQAIHMLLEDINTLRMFYRKTHSWLKNPPEKVVEADNRLEKEIDRLNFIHDMLMVKKNKIISKEIRGQFYDVVDGFDDISKSITSDMWL